MSKLSKSLVVIGGVVVATAASAYPWDIFNFDESRPYLGAEYKYQHLKGKNDWNEVLPKDFSAGTIFGGLRFSEKFGLELGYTHSDMEKRNEFLTGVRFGQAASNVSSVAKVKFDSINLDANGYVPLNDALNLVGTLGVGFMKGKFDGSDTTQTAGTLIDEALLNTTDGNRRIVPRIGFGAEWMFHDMFGARARVLWEGTSALRFKEHVATTSNKPFKDSCAFTFGLFAQF